MRFTIKALGAAVALTVASSAAHAQEVMFSGSASGTFGAGTPAALTYQGSTFNDMTSGGFLAFGTAPASPNVNNFGSFTLANTTATFNNTFSLLLTFTNPAGVQGGQGQTFGSTIIGNVSSDGRGGVFVNFANAANPRTLTFNGGTFTLSVNNVSINAANSGSTSVVPITGTITASVVPEPSTYALMGTGLAGLIGLARRRRAVA